ncbi:hypothetical protein FYJ33_13195 [Clostridiaceae bacterium WCA-383-APC-5B]|uniref:Uncharacterized protein n=2 Tax=Inconstantimicrobium porci TaxID=2652291 RepID=A0A7X2N085_9CLOT|nr:hypothetical protein [Inconstantimicrobium porci]
MVGDKVKNFIKKELFPMIQNNSAEKKMNEKIARISNYDSEDINNLELQYVRFDNQTKLENMKSEYDNSINRVAKFEDKAKSNLVAISISVTIILGLIKPINEIYTKYNNIVIKIIGTILCFGVVFFMLYAGILSLKVLMEKNVLYKVSLIELNKVNLIQLNNSDEPMKKTYAQNIELNEMNNTIRNNYINTSFRCIRNALSLLVVIFIIGIIPISNNQENDMEDKLNEIQDSINEINNDITRFKVEESNSTDLINKQEESMKKLEEDIAILKSKLSEQENKK